MNIYYGCPHLANTICGDISCRRQNFNVALAMTCLPLNGTRKYW